MDAGGELVAAAKAARDEGKAEAAANLYLQAADHARREGDRLACAHRLRHAGDILRETGREAEAAPCYAEALALYRADPATPALDLANLLRPLALLKEQAGARIEAAALWAEAKRLYEAAGVEAGAKECETQLAGLGRKANL